MQVFINGQDGMGWAIDTERNNAELFIKSIGHTITRNILFADVIHSVLWSLLFNKTRFFIPFKKNIIAGTASKVDIDSAMFKKAKKFVSVWIAPNTINYNILKSELDNVVMIPHYINEKVFCKLPIIRIDICHKLNIRYDQIKNKFLIGSFQRDTEGHDLSTPKWQKNPELLIEILDNLPNKNEWIFIIAGPRRHYVLNECKRRKIPYLFIGKMPKSNEDDLNTNILDQSTMVYLYNLIDCYIVTSKSEGGPKSILESCLTKTAIFSTPVGIAPDVLPKDCLFSRSSEIIPYLKEIISNKNSASLINIEDINYHNAITSFSFGVMKQKWSNLYSSLKK